MSIRHLLANVGGRNHTGHRKAVRAEAMLEELEPRQMMAADLSLELNDAYAPLDYYTLGERYTLPMALRNNSSESFTGFYRLTLTYALNQQGQEPVPLPVESVVEGQITNLAPDASAQAVLNQYITDDFQPGDFDIHVSLEMFSDAARTVPIADEYPQDNTVASSNEFTVNYVFGNYGTRTGVVLKGEDADGTVFSLSLTGGGYGMVTPPGMGPGANVVDVYPTTNGASTLAVSFVSKSAPADEFVDLPGTEVHVNARLAAFTAPVLNLGGSITMFGLNSGTGAGPAVTMRNMAGGITADGNLGAVRVNSFSPYSGGAVMTNNGLFVNGNVASLNVGNTDGVTVQISGNVGAMTFGNMAGTTVDVGGTSGALVGGNLTSTQVTVGRTLPSITLGNVSQSTFILNTDGPVMRTSLAVSMNNVEYTSFEAQMQISTFSVNRWVDAAPGFPAANSWLYAVAITSLTTRSVQTTADPTLGEWDADVFISGFINRSTQLGTVNIQGVLTGSFYVGGSVGSFTARTVNTGAIDPAAGDGPTLAASGTVTAFTATNAVSGGLWAGQIRTATVNVTSNNSSFEVAAGLRLNRVDFDSGDPVTILHGDAMNPDSGARWASGAIGTLNVSLRTPAGGAVTGFRGRFIAGVDLTTMSATVGRDMNGALDFVTNTPRTTGNTTVSKISTINVTGSLTNNDLKFAFLTYPAARFNYGTPATSVLIPAAANPPVTSSTGIAGVTPASTFFRVGRPVI